MKNPWEEIKEGGEYILTGDKNRIKDFNDNLKKKHAEFRIQTRLIPDPFFGDKDAKIILLMLNPGFGTHEEENYQKNNFKKILIHNLTHKNSKKHFFSLDKTFEGTDAYDYWTPRVKGLNEKGFDNEFLSERIFCINLFPYHSKEYKPLKGELLESQKYALFLLNDAIKKKDSLIISMRSYKKWAKAYSEEYRNAKSFDLLVKERKMLRVSSYQNPTLSYKNLLQKNGFNGFEKLVTKLKKTL